MTVSFRGTLKLYRPGSNLEVISANERCQVALLLCGFRELDNVLSRVIMGSGPDPFRFPFPAWCSRLRQASHRRSSPGCIATYSFILFCYGNVPIMTTCLLWKLFTRKTGKKKPEKNRHRSVICSILPNSGAACVLPPVSMDSPAKQLWNQAPIRTQSHQSSLAPFVHRRKPHSKQELEPQ